MVTTEREGRLDETDGSLRQLPVGAQRREYWPTQRVFACLGTVTVAAVAIPLAALSRVPVAIPVVHDVDGYDEHVDWSTLFLPQNVLGSALALAFLFGVWVPFLMRSLRALMAVGSIFVLGWLCAGVALAFATNQRIGDALSTLVMWPLVSLGLGGPAFFIALAVAAPGIYVGIAIENRTKLPQPTSAPRPLENPPGYAQSTVGVPPPETPPEHTGSTVQRP
jgi:hypothetical protein